MEEEGDVLGRLLDWLHSSSTVSRIAKIHELQHKILQSEINQTSFEVIALALFRTYPFYQDRRSRKAVRLCLNALIATPTNTRCLSLLVQMFEKETSRDRITSSSAFVLVEWGGLFLQHSSFRAEVWKEYGRSLILSEARALDICLSTAARSSVRKSALLITRRAFRDILSNSATSRDIIDMVVSLLTATNSPLGLRGACLLDVVIGVCARLRTARASLEANKSKIIAFYNRAVLGSRAAVPQHLAAAFHNLFSDFITSEDFLVDITPALEKGLLRAPEVVLNDLVSPLVGSLPVAFDLTESLAKHLMKPLLSNLKSTNAAIRSGALSAFAVLVEKCHDVDLLADIVDDILTPLTTSKIAAAEQRSLLARMISKVPFVPSRSKAICDGLVVVISKESNEGALNADIVALTRHVGFAFKTDSSVSQDITPVVIDTFEEGVKDKRVPIRKTWIICVGVLLWQIRNQEASSTYALRFMEAVAPLLFEVYNEVVANPLLAGQSGLIVGGYVVTALIDTVMGQLQDKDKKLKLRSNEVLKTALMIDPKPSFLLNFRIYTKLSTSEDLIWAIRALGASSRVLVDYGPGSNLTHSWAQMFLYLITAAALPPDVHKEAMTALSTAYLQQATVISSIVIDGIWQWHRHVELDDRETPAAAARTGNSRLYLAIQCLLPRSKETASGILSIASLGDQLINMLVLCRPEILPRVSWIEICLSVGQDPGSLVQAKGTQCLMQLDRILNANDQEFSAVPYKIAAYNTAAELAFVAPETITPILLQRIQVSLSASNVRLCGPTEIAIAKTPEGTICMDVLGTKGQPNVIDKNNRDYDTMKWEEDVRTQLAQKKGLQKKLTAEEQAKVEAQLAKENAIRRNVKEIVAKVENGIGLINALATGPPTDADTWMGPSLKALRDAIIADVRLLIGNSADNAYIACSERISSRLGPSKRFLGIATLRALGCSQFPESLEQEPLKDLVTRLLYRLRLASEQRPFDSVTLIYIIPLLSLVLTKNGIDCLSADEIDEQLTLSLEILSYHSESFSQRNLPRSEVLALLVSCMQQYPLHYKVIKDCLLDICRAVGSNITASETAVLLKGAIVPEVSVKNAALQAIRADIDLTDLDFCEEIWLASHDDVIDVAELGQRIWTENALESEPVDAIKILPYLASPDQSLQRAAAKSLVASISADRDTFVDIMQRLEDQYRKLSRPKLPSRDEYGMPKKTDLIDPWEARCGLAFAFREMAPSFQPSDVVPFITFLMKDNALGDRNIRVREEMIGSATAIIAYHGMDNVEELMAMFEIGLRESKEDSSTSDLVNEASIILYGALARHLPSGDERVPKVVEILLMALSTPSESVQHAVAECLPPLVQNSSQRTPEYVQSTLTQLFQGKSYATRRGAAYGLAGIVGGKGVVALRDLRIMSTLRGAVDNKKDYNYRQGAFLAYELLSLILGRVFEPYVIQIVPQLLSGFGDSSADVREACLDTAKVCFANLSSYGVKLILPTLLDGLEESQWRSKKGACDSLGAMAYLDPQQLALSLPQIIPPLTNVLNDSHKEVRTSANRSLQRFGEVISNPEVKGVVVILLKALSDPTRYTDDALDALIKISFVHYLDAPSLALVIRILERGLGDRSATKRKSAQIIGSLAHLTEKRDLISHLPVLVAGLKLAAVDPVPTTRATASKALGSLVEKLGEDAMPDLIPGLMSTLKSDTGAGDRLGSAQALSEVLAGLGTSRLEDTLPTILQNVASSKPAIREGFMSLFIYLPACFGNSFSVYLSKIIPSILSGLADDIESIRETSLRAGRLLVKNFSTRAIDLLLPELDRGLADDRYRIRLSSVELVGDLLFNLTGISGKSEEADEEEGAAEAGQSLLEVLGEDKRNRILSSLYICRCDTSGLVRTAAINVWKALVATPKTLKELVPTLSQLIIRRLASSNMEQRVIAGNALGELIRKAGEGVLASLLPSLEKDLGTSIDANHKQGICIALREIIASASLEALEDYEHTLTAIVRIALVDPDDEVREAAAEAFDSLQKILGKRAVDQVLPHLLNLLRTDGGANTALAALLTLLEDNTRSNIILPNLVPTLLVSPMTSFNAKAIASLSKVAGPAITRRLPVILNTLVDNLIVQQDEDLRSHLEGALDAVLSSLDEFDGLNTAMSVMLALVKHDDHRKRATADISLSRFFSGSDVDFSRYHQDLIRVLLISFDDQDSQVLKAAWLALTELTKRLRKEEMESLVVSTRTVLRQVGVPGVDLPGFRLPKGINAVLPIFLQGLMNGTAEQRTQSALAISDIVDRTSADSLKPFVTQITGPLIRVISERSVDVKCAILLTLNNLLGKIPLFLKPFLPQLQRTFAKSLADTTSEVLRFRAAKALGTLITMTPRIDPLIAELVTGSRASDAGVQSAMLKALYEVVSKAGSNMSEASRTSLLSLIDRDAGNADDSMAIMHARLFGALAKSLPPSDMAGIIKHRVLIPHLSHALVLNLNAVLLELADSFNLTFGHEVSSIICQGIRSKDIFIADNCVLAAGKYLLSRGNNVSTDAMKTILETLAGVVKPGVPIDTRRLSLVVIRTISRNFPDTVSPHILILAPSIFASVRDPAIPVKLAAEAAFLTIFSVVENENVEFETYMEGAGAELNPTVKRSMQDYFKRVAVRLGGQARERKEAEGGQNGLGLSNDERDDEREIWSVGKVDLGESAFAED